MLELSPGNILTGADVDFAGDGILNHVDSAVGIFTHA